MFSVIETIRNATKNDIPRVVELLAKDTLGQQRETFTNPLPDCYYAAFALIDNDPNNYLLVMEINGEVIGTLQLTIIPNLTYRGSKRALIEGVRIDEAYRSQGLGEKFIAYAVNQSREEGCYLVELTTDKRRDRAMAFYKKLGFVASHEGFKLKF